MPHHRNQHAFSLVEMVMVIMTMGIVAMIAAPRLTRAAEDAQASAMVANVRVLQNAIEMYCAEHNNLNPAQNADQSVSTNGARFAARLLNQTDELGGAVGILGPYLRRVPINPSNDKSTIRIDGPATGANLAGWRFDSAKRRILPDHLPEAAAELIIRTRIIGGNAKGGAGAATLEVEALGLD